MRNNKKIKFQKLFIFLLILVLGIGFAYVTRRMYFELSGYVKNNRFEVYFEDVQLKNGSVTRHPPVINDARDTVTYSIELFGLGDYYEFTVKAVNSGTLDAVIDLIDATEIDESLSDNVDCQITYMDGTPLQRGDILVAGETVVYKVRLEYTKELTAEEYPEGEEELPLDLSFSVKYLAADNQGSNRRINHDYITSHDSIQMIKNSDISSLNVYFDNIRVMGGSASTSSASLKDGKIDYSILLESPGDYYGFRIDLVNSSSKDIAVLDIAKQDYSSDLLYQFTYEDGTQVQVDDLIKANTRVTYKVLVKYQESAEPLELANSVVHPDLSVVIEYSTPAKNFIKLIENGASNDSSLNFTTTSGSGLYVRNGTQSNTYPIYYYRGAVTNNNAKFAGYCWKIVRTTETGGTKLIYNGRPNSSGQCVNTTGTATQLSSTYAYGENQNSLAYTGYMHGNVYAAETALASFISSTYYGASFTFTNGKYYLSNYKDGGDSTHHYGCLNYSDSCYSYINYVFYADNASKAYSITLHNGESVEDAIAEMKKNTTNSVAKTAVDNWFSNEFVNYFTNRGINYSNYLEDTIWCNDRSVYDSAGWNPNGGNMRNSLYYSAYNRVVTGAPSLVCSNKNDSFTVSTTNGNTKLSYPVGLLTADEVMLAGGQDTMNTSYYLYTGQDWWTMSPYGFITEGYSNVYIVGSSGYLTRGNTNISKGIRPTISLKPGVKIAPGGNGSSSTPYEFLVD